MGSKKRSPGSENIHVTKEPLDIQSILDREEPITPPQKLAVCYMNRAHDSLAGVPYSVWAELCAWLWKSPNGISCACPNMIGLKAPDAVPLPINQYLRQIDGGDKMQRIVLGETERIVWIYPKV